MPVWAWVVVSIASGLGSGLLGTLVKVRSDRHAEIRQRALEATEEVAVRADDWFQTVDAAIESRWEHLYATGESDPAVAAARESLAEARTTLNRLHLLIPHESRTAKLARAFVNWLEGAVCEIEAWPPEVTEDDDDDCKDDNRDTDGEPYDAMGEAFEESYREAKLLRTLGLTAYGEFSRAASAELRRGYFWPRLLGSMKRRAHSLYRRWRHPLERRRRAAELDSLRRAALAKRRELDARADRATPKGD